MSTASPLIVADSGLRSYINSYIITALYGEKDDDGVPIQKEDFYIWKYINPNTKPTLVSSLRAEAHDRLQIVAFTDEFFLATTSPFLYEQGLLLYRIIDGTLTDEMALTIASGDEVALDSPENYQFGRAVRAGDEQCVGFANGLIAVFSMGPHRRSSDTTIEIYKISEDGKFILIKELRLISDHPLVVSWRPKVFMPGVICMSVTEFVCASQFSNNHDVHFLRWSSDPTILQPSHAQFCAGAEADEGDEEHYCSWNQDTIDLSRSPLNAFITAHEEGDSRDQYAPYTLIRCVDATTLELHWATPVDQYFNIMHACESAGLLFMAGYDYKLCYLTAIDLQTGAIRRIEITNDRSARGFIYSHISCNVSCEGELIIVNSDGEVMVLLLSDFREHGYPTGDGCNKYAVRFFPAFDPKPEIAEHTKDEQGSEGRENWVGSSFLGDGFILLGDRNWAQYAIICRK